MTQQVKLPDGTIANFPDGMGQADMEAVIQQRFPVKPEETSFGARVMTGLQDPIYGAAQLADRFLVDPIRQAITPGASNMSDVIRQRNAEYVAPEGIDAARLLGNVANPITYGAGLGVGALAGAGVISGAVQPRDPNLSTADYARQTAIDAGVGGLIGAAAPAVGQVIRAGYGEGARMVDRVLGSIENLTAKVQPERLTGSSSRMGEFVQTADDLGLRVPASVRRESNFIENVGLTLESSPLTSKFVPDIAGHNQQRLNQLVKEAVGLPEDVALTPAVLREAEKNTGAMFRDLADKGTTKIGSFDAYLEIEKAMPEAFVGKDKVLKHVQKLLKDYPGEMNTDRMMALQSSLGDLARKAKGETRNAIQQARESIIDAIPANPGQEAQFKLAREQWAAQRAVMDSVGQRGTIRANALSKRLSASDANSPIGRLARAAETINYMRPSSYGTENARRGGLAGTAMTGLAGAAGVGWALK